MAPPVACPAAALRSARGDSAPASEDLSASSESGGRPVSEATYRISSPEPGQQLSGLVSIMGTAMFESGQFQYYKLEIGTGRNPASWVTLGETHSQPVQSGLLEELHAYALAPGDYVLRLVLVQNDGNYPPPFTVPIEIIP